MLSHATFTETLVYKFVKVRPRRHEGTKKMKVSGVSVQVSVVKILNTTRTSTNHNDEFSKQVLENSTILKKKAKIFRYGCKHKERNLKWKRH